ncbi:Cation efflux system protein CusC precursor [Methylibium sp. T29-B]|uniref:efflux transporter outer membrane subunit n=2 Tax=unclassified Methylibium TaxID=2633235 RepID=UPI0003F3D26A|nr:efflux transporter outer membrane subunit [Methylibium sp. T29-B]EWS62080.1 Cation efflux system protein CusC precursor [Methylibium sp. T29-B]
MIKTSLTTIALAVLLAACGTAAPLAVPAPELPGAFAQGQGIEVGRVAQPDWWSVFADPALDALVQRGLEANLDLRQAAERVQRSRALAAGAHADRGPGGGVAAGARAQQLGRFEAPGATRDERRSDSVSAATSLSWEVDLFGRLRSAAQAADARARAVEADAAAMRLAVAAEIAQAWFSLNGTRAQMQLASKVADNRRSTLDLVLRRVAAGYASPLDEARARAELAAAESDRPALDAALAVSSHRLAVLLGASPSGYEAPSAAHRSPMPVALRLPDPAQWAAQRPDLQAAEARLQALSLDVEAVRAEFLPRLSISGVLGVVAGSVSGLGAAGAASWFVAPSVSVPVFDHARIDARLQATRAGEREALLAYRQRVLLATEEVESTLAQVRQGQLRLASLQEQARQAVVAEQLARKRFEAGGTDLLELLDAQRSAQQAEIGLSVALTGQQQQVVGLQRALGARFLPVDGDAKLAFGSRSSPN